MLLLLLDLLMLNLLHGRAGGVPRRGRRRRRYGRLLVLDLDLGSLVDGSLHRGCHVGVGVAACRGSRAAGGLLPSSAVAGRGGVVRIVEHAGRLGVFEHAGEVLFEDADHAISCEGLG